jgi:hypothetical protein
MKFHEDYLVECPYYKDESQQTLHCEGVEEGCGLQLGFRGKKRLQTYKEQFCRCSWKTCMVAQMLNRKYDYQP